MKGEYLSCRAWIDETGLAHPTKEHARNYRDSKPGQFSLGKNYEAEIQQILDKRIHELEQQLCCTNEGELIPEKLKIFNEKIKPNLRRQAQNKLAKYERHSTRLRNKNGMNPFTWELETADRIREQALGKGRLPRLPNLDPVKLAEKYKSEELWPGFPGPAPVKPEYQGDKHPLQQNQVTRTANPVGRSKRAQQALEHYEKTGKLTVPPRETAKTEREHKKWHADMPICSKPIQHIEGLDYVIHDVQKRLKTRLDDIEKGVWPEIEPIKPQKRRRYADSKEKTQGK